MAGEGKRSKRFALSIMVGDPELVGWLRDLPPHALNYKVEKALAAGHYVLNLFQEDARALLREFRDGINSAQTVLFDSLRDIDEAIGRADSRVQQSAERLAERLEGGMLAIPQGGDRNPVSELPEPTRPHIVAGIIGEMEKDRDKRAEAFLGLYELAYNHNLHISAEGGDSWVLFDGQRKVARTSGSRQRVDVVFEVPLGQPVTVVPPVETVNAAGELVVNGSDVQQLLDRVGQRLAVHVSRSVAL